MKEVKPIFIVKYPDSFDSNEIYYMQEALSALENDYYVLFANSPNSHISFECFNHDISEIELEELKQKVLKQCLDS